MPCVGYGWEHTFMELAPPLTLYSSPTMGAQGRR
jgi:hypothetical protein